MTLKIQKGTLGTEYIKALYPLIIVSIMDVDARMIWDTEVKLKTKTDKAFQQDTRGSKNLKKCKEFLVTWVKWPMLCQDWRIDGLLRWNDSIRREKIRIWNQSTYLPHNKDFF